MPVNTVVRSRPGCAKSEMTRFAGGESVRLRAEPDIADRGRTKRAFGVLLLPSLVLTSSALWLLYVILSHIGSPAWMHSPWFGPLASRSGFSWAASLAILGPVLYVGFGFCLLAMAFARIGVLPADLWGEVVDPENLRVSWPGRHRVLALRSCDIEQSRTHWDGSVSLTLFPANGPKFEMPRLTRREVELLLAYHEAAQRRR